MVCIFKVIHYCVSRCLKTYELDPAYLYFYNMISMPSSLAKLDLLANIDMLLMVEKGIRGEICHGIHRYA